MKKIIILLLTILILFSCQDPYTGIDNYLTHGEQIKTVDPVLFALHKNNELKFYDGTEITTIDTGNIIFVSNRIISIDDILYRFDNYGAILASIPLLYSPDKIFIDGSDIWQIINISPAEAYSNGGLYRWYSHIIKNDIEISPWYTYQFKTININKSITDKIIITNECYGLENITDSVTPLKIFEDLYIEDINMNLRTGIINDTNISFIENYLLNARWQKCDDKWFSNCGMEFSNTGFIENSTSLIDFKSITYPYVINYLPNMQKPSLHPAGQNYEGTEWVAYFIESTSGHLIRYRPGVDEYDILTKLFYGPKIMSEGNLIAKTLNPQWIEDKMYFHYDGFIKIYNPATELVTTFSEDMELFKW